MIQLSDGIDVVGKWKGEIMIDDVAGEWGVYQFARATIKCSRWGGSNNSSRGWKSEIRVLARYIFS